ncbi:MAG: TerB family tellurite resistance protein [Alphaproteobacteria bacterium]|nr:TerB family tellurite resistance protein [Alphaproteobacteria bacterium]
MSRVAEYLELVDEPERGALDGTHPHDEPLLALLVQMAYSDGIVQDDELALLSRIRPDLDVAGVMEWAAGVAERTFDPRVLAAAITSPADRWTTLRLATRMVCMDGDVADEEVGILRDLAEVFDLDDEAPDRAVAEVVAQGGPIARERVSASLRNMMWDRVEPTRDEPEVELEGVAPEDATHVCTMKIEDEEVAALYFEGLLALFEGGPKFVRWDEIRTYTRVPVPGASFHLHTNRDHLKMSDPRMRDVGRLLDYIYGREALPDA